MSGTAREATSPGEAGGLRADGGARPPKPEGPRLPADLIALAQNGATISFAACGPDGRPVAGLGAGVRIDPAGIFRVYLNARNNRRLLEALESGSGIAATFVRAPDHRGFQVKAGRAAVVPANPDHFAELERQCAVMRDELVELGLPINVASAFGTFDPSDILAVEFRPEEAFMQTPGPGAGSPVT